MKITRHALLLCLIAVIFNSCKKEPNLIEKSLYGPLPGYIWTLTWDDGKFDGDVIFSTKKQMLYYKDGVLKIGGNWVLIPLDKSSLELERQVSFDFEGPNKMGLLDYHGKLSEQGDEIKGEVIQTDVNGNGTFIAKFFMNRTEKGNRAEILLLDGYGQN
ncbi:hypothetical protein [Pedobacter foliorum]|uniref:hypothetical protein n=1 Tax=Pedobacter foliorum TaxID=2739058 RepID=UPI0015640C9C|nr:hypothetical protein [Pedobacter foliorum]NRF37624.1 hypothetical protein [Pedobacter foliorum]